MNVNLVRFTHLNYIDTIVQIVDNYLLKYVKNHYIRY